MGLVLRFDFNLGMDYYGAKAGKLGRVVVNILGGNK